MGEDKALRPFLGQPLIQRLLDRFEGVGQETLIITNQPPGYESLDVPLHRDLIPDRGALGGLYTALSVSSQPYIALIAADLPFASPALISYLLEKIQQEEADAVLPSSDHGLEPLHAVYRRESCLPLVKKALENDRWRMTCWHGQAKIHLIPAPDARLVSGSPHTFINVNTPEEFQRAEALAAQNPDL